MLASKYRVVHLRLGVPMIPTELDAWRQQVSAWLESVRREFERAEIGRLVEAAEQEATHDR